MAQQAKAYENVKYTARIKNGVFHLDYADGYVGASKIRLVSNRQKTQLFTAQYGTPDANGNFVLNSRIYLSFVYYQLCWAAILLKSYQATIN